MKHGRKVEKYINMFKLFFLKIPKKGGEDTRDTINDGFDVITGDTFSTVSATTRSSDTNIHSFGAIAVLAIGVRVGDLPRP